MACLVWKLPSGERYNVAENTAHNPAPGAVNTGIVDWDCEGSTGQSEVDAILEKHGLKLGSAIAWVTKRVGLRQCSSCKAREVILDNAGKLGWAETIRQIKETL